MSRRATDGEEVREGRRAFGTGDEMRSGCSEERQKRSPVNVNDEVEGRPEKGTYTSTERKSERRVETGSQ